MNFTPEQITKAKAAKSVEELLAYAKEIGFALTEDEAKFYFAQWNKVGELADKELSNVSGGSQCVDGKTYSSDPPYYLITTIGNSCPDYTFLNSSDSRSVDNGTCYQCIFSSEATVPMYCRHRTIGSDPFR